MADPITPEDSVLTSAIKDMSFSPWQADPAVQRMQTPAQAYMAQRRYWLERLHNEEPASLDIFVENYPPRTDMVGGVALGASEVQAHISPVGATKRETILRTANTIIHGDREKDYGSPVDSFTRLAAAIQLVLDPIAPGIKITPATAAKVMIAMKLSRLAGGDEKDDTWVDLAGYSALGAEVRDQQ